MDDVIRGVQQAIRGRDGRLVGLTIATSVDPGEAEDRLYARLRSIGLGAVEVHWMRGAGPTRLVSLEFSR